jgi:hypothetical protein
MEHWIEASEKAQEGQTLDMGTNAHLDVERHLEGILDGYTVLGSQGEVLACIGVTEVDDDTAYAWTMMVANIGARLAGITKCVRAWLDSCGYKTVMANVRQEFYEGQRWARLLGFEESGTIVNYYNDGGTAIMYRRER